MNNNYVKCLNFTDENNLLYTLRVIILLLIFMCFKCYFIKKKKTLPIKIIWITCG